MAANHPQEPNDKIYNFTVYFGGEMQNHKGDASH